MQLSLMQKAPFIDSVKLTVDRYLRLMTTQDRDVVETKQSYSCIHFHRKMHRLLRTLWSNSNAEMNALGIIQRLAAEPKIRPPLHALWNEMGHLYQPLVDSLQHITEWKDSSAASKAEQLRVAVCRGSFVLSLAVLNKVLALALPLSKSFQDSCLEKNGGLNQRSVFVRFGKQLKSCTVI
ncbi:hypothetical protein T06_15361 [Trichinella sp. T6]|nr:hypothetical protein T06_15361 [Trichinella sp. T6]